MKAYRKLIAALVGAATTAVALGLLPDASAKWVAVFVAFVTAAGVYKVPNDDTGASAIEVCVGVLALIAVLWACGVVPR